jgi:prepilin-type N-terminal cleavage/methylation domain-containing protein
MDRKGVTLVELVTVVMIVAITVSLTFPNIATWLSIYRLRTATRNIISTMRSAKMMAVVRNVEHRVHFEAAAGSYILQYRTTAGIWLDEGAPQMLPQGILFQEINLPSRNAEFNPDATCSSGNILLRDRKQKERKIVLFSATGRIRAEPPL